MPVTVTTAEGDYAQTITVRQHTLAADEPTSAGGTDTGPDPYELLLASLGACTAMTVQMYAQRKDWPLAAVSVQLGHSKQHAKDCEDCEIDHGKVDIIEKHVTLSGDLKAEQHARLLEIAVPLAAPNSVSLSTAAQRRNSAGRPNQARSGRARRPQMRRSTSLPTNSVPRPVSSAPRCAKRRTPPPFRTAALTTSWWQGARGNSETGELRFRVVSRVLFEHLPQEGVLATRGFQIKQHVLDP